jgi:Tol biopolymer transport system component
LLVAIPDPNLIYATDKVPATALWKIDLTGTKTQIGNVQADFFGLPQFSPEGKHILYAQRIGSVKDNQIALYQANSDGSGQKEIVRDTIGKLEPARWLPDGSAYTFVHGTPGDVWLAHSGDQSPERLPNDSTLVFSLVWADATTYIYETSTGGSGEIQYSGTDPTLHTIAQCSACGELDARR